MNKLLGFAFVFIATILCIDKAFAIKCYVCNSHDTPLCQTDPSKNTSFIEECPPDETVCRKIHQWVTIEEGGLGPDERVIRSCGFNQTADKVSKSCTSITNIDSQQDMCFCITDECNSAPYSKYLNKILPLLLSSLSIGASVVYVRL